MIEEKTIPRGEISWLNLDLIVTISRAGSGQCWTHSLQARSSLSGRQCRDNNKKCTQDDEKVKAQKPRVSVFSVNWSLDSSFCFRWKTKTFTRADRSDKPSRSRKFNEVNSLKLVLRREEIFFRECHRLISTSTLDVIRWQVIICH